MNTNTIGRWADEDHWYQPWPFILGWILVALIDAFEREGK